MVVRLGPWVVVEDEEEVVEGGSVEDEEEVVDVTMLEDVVDEEGIADEMVLDEEEDEVVDDGSVEVESLQQVCGVVV